MIDGNYEMDLMTCGINPIVHTKGTVSLTVPFDAFQTKEWSLVHR